MGVSPKVGVNPGVLCTEEEEEEEDSACAVEERNGKEDRGRCVCRTWRSERAEAFTARTALTIVWYARSRDRVSIGTYAVCVALVLSLCGELLPFPLLRESMATTRKIGPNDLAPSLVPFIKLRSLLEPLLTN